MPDLWHKCKRGSVERLRNNSSRNNTQSQARGRVSDGSTGRRRRR